MSQFKNTSGIEIKRITDPQNSSRRRAVKTIAGGVGALAAYHVLPVNWSKPIIEQVFLPAHAAVSGITLSDPCTAELVSGNQETSIDVIRVSGFVTPPVAGLEVTVVATPNGGSGGPVTVMTSTGSDGTYSAEITMVGGPGIIGVGATTTVAGVNGVAHCPVGIPPADHPSANRPPQTTQPAPAVTLTILGQKVSCGIDLPTNSNGSVSQVYRVQLSPSPSADTTVVVQCFVNDFSIITFNEPMPVSGITNTFNIDIGQGTAQPGDILRCQVTYAAASASAECINPIVAATP